jgi:hypothetical protein
MTRARIRAPFDGKIIPPKRQQNHHPQGRDSCQLASSLRMAIPLLIATSRRRALFTWSCVPGKACGSSSRPSLARRPVLGRTVASPTSFPLEEPASVSATTSLRLARQVRLQLVHGARRTTRASPLTHTNGRISTSRGNNSWRPCRQPAPARALMQV